MEPRRAQFTLPESADSSRASSPAPDDFNDRDRNMYITTPDGFLIPSNEKAPPGRRSSDIYDLSLSWWRAAARRRIVQNVRNESEIIARMQVHLS